MLSLVHENVQESWNSVSPKFLDSLSLKLGLRDEANRICDSSSDFSNWTTALFKWKTVAFIVNNNLSLELSQVYRAKMKTDLDKRGWI